MKRFCNWLCWAIKLRTIPPRNVGYISHRKPTRQDIERGLEIEEKLGL